MADTAGSADTAGKAGADTAGAAAHLLIERAEGGRVVVVTMNRPEAKNAFSLQMLALMAEAWDEIDGDDDVRCAILTGADGTFSAGADLKMMAGASADDPWAQRFKDDPDLHWKALLRHRQLKKPLVAAVEGIAYGGGTEILQATDIRVASEAARFGITEARWALFPVGGSSVRLPRQIPYAKAMDMLLTGRSMKADEAERIGLVSRLAPEGKALDEAIKVGAQIAANGPLAVQALKRSVYEGNGLTEADALKIELDVGYPILSTEDAKEGPRAFMEKRKPEFVGR